MLRLTFRIFGGMVTIPAPERRFSLGTIRYVTTHMKLITFFRSVRREFKHISWPTQHETIAYTVAVVVLTLAIAYYLGLFDWLFTLGLETVLNR